MQRIIDSAVTIATWLVIIWLAILMFMLAGAFILSLFGMLPDREPDITPRNPEFTAWVVSGTL